MSPRSASPLRLPALLPTGTARAIFLGATPPAAAPEARPDDREPLSNDLRAALGARDVAEGTLWAAWEVGTWVAAAPPAERRAFVCLVVALLQSVEGGGAFLSLGDAGLVAGPLDSALRRLGLGDGDRLATRQLAARLLAGTAPAPIGAMAGPPGSRRPFVLADDALYPERLWCLEQRLIALLRTRMAATPPALASTENVRNAVGALANGRSNINLIEEQLRAVTAALENPLTIVAGGPGSGKTATVVGLLRALGRLGISPEEVALAAPTGRAAQRMKESVDAALAGLVFPETVDLALAAGFTGAVTLHRLLGIRPGGTRWLEPEVPTFYQDWPLPHRVVVVDEASMIDLDLMTQLLAATGPETRLVLLGDVDQLPSVQVGAVFRDLVGAAPRVTRHLTRSHRMDPSDTGGGAQILRVARAINAGGGWAGTSGSPELAPLRQRASQLTFLGYERLSTGALEEFLDRWYREVLVAETNLPLALQRRVLGDSGNQLVSDAAALGGDEDSARTLLRTLQAARILCVTREAGGTSSAAAINRRLHARARAAVLARGAGSWLDADAAFLPGEPVMVLRNDYSRQLSNGDMGIVSLVRNARGDSPLVVVFASPTGLVAHPLEVLESELALAYALTVHKAQGSEYDRVALVLPEGDVPLLTREIVYTALTRARQGVVVLGDPALFDLAVARTLDRTSGIATRLATRP